MIRKIDEGGEEEKEMQQMDIREFLMSLWPTVSFRVRQRWS